MLKKICAVAALFFLFPGSAFCSAFYIGAGLGPQYANFEQNVHLVQGTITNVTDNTNLSGTGIFGTVFGGYEYQYQRFYLAGELNANASSVNFKSSNSEAIHGTSSSTQYKVNQSYGISVLPGFLFLDSTLFYARLGYANGNFSVSTSDASLANINTNLNGFRFGAGIKQAVSKSFSVRLEYSQVNYQSTSMHVVAPPIVKDTQITPQVAQVEFGLVYSFG